MPPSAANPTLPDEGQNNAAGRYDDDEAVPDGDDAESIDSNITQEVGCENLLRYAADHRERKVTLGGIPTRPIAEYSKESVQKILFIPPGQKGIRTDDETYYHHYCLRERDYFYEELQAWESFLRHIRRDWVKRNEAAGGSIPPPPPVVEMDSLDLHTQYFGYMLRIRKADEEYAKKYNDVFRCWKFRSYGGFLRHIVAVHKQVTTLREQRGLQDEPTEQEQEQMAVVKRQLGIGQAPREPASDANPLQWLVRNPSDQPAESKVDSSKRMKIREDAAPEPGPELRVGSQEAGAAPTTKKRKYDGFEDEADVATAKVTSKRGKVGSDTHDDDADLRASELVQDAKDAQAKERTIRRRRGRPRKQPQHTLELEKTKQDEIKGGRKRRGRPQKKAQEAPAQGTGAAARKGNNTAAPSATGLRRSGRIASKMGKDSVR